MKLLLLLVLLASCGGKKNNYVGKFKCPQCSTFKEVEVDYSDNDVYTVKNIITIDFNTIVIGKLHGHSLITKQEYLSNNNIASTVFVYEYSTNYDTIKMSSSDSKNFLTYIRE
jgi:hypothetical protein